MSFIEKVFQPEDKQFKGCIFKCEFNLAQYRDALVFALLEHNLDPKLHNAVNKRKAEFTAGRYMAKCCLQQHRILNTKVPIGANRAPMWPPNIIGSITHTNNIAICATAEKSTHRYLGIDIEPVMSEQTAQQIAKAVLVNDEYHLVSAIEKPNPLILTLIFSAKESLFKALYPEVQRYFDFDAAQVTSINLANRQIQLKLVKSLTAELEADSHFQATFDISDQHVTTILYTT